MTNSDKLKNMNNLYFTILTKSQMILLMSSTNLFQRYCEKCLKEIPYLADICPHCTADISGTNGDEQIVKGAFVIFSSWEKTKKYFLTPLLIFAVSGIVSFFIGFLIGGIDWGFRLLCVTLVISFFYYANKESTKACNSFIEKMKKNEN